MACTECERLRARIAEVTALYDKYGEHIQGCSAYVEMYSCDCGFIEANAAREKDSACHPPSPYDLAAARRNAPSQRDGEKGDSQ